MRVVILMISLALSRIMGVVTVPLRQVINFTSSLIDPVGCGARINDLVSKKGQRHATACVWESLNNHIYVD